MFIDSASDDSINNGLRKEKCKEGTKDLPGNKDCQTVMTSGVLSFALSMTNFDAIVFLEQYNEGSPMTVPEIASQWYVIDPLKEKDGSDKIAVIDCHNEQSARGATAGSIGGEDPTRW